MNVGDRVRVVLTDPDDGLHITNGETGVISEVLDDSPFPYTVTLDNGETDWFYSADELEVIE